MAEDHRRALVVFGATGFTGERVAREAAKRAPPGWNGELRWAIAGRDREKLAAVAERLECGPGVLKPEILIAGAADEVSIGLMCRTSCLIVNCVGPFRFYGETVVRNCVENGTDYVDITGEPEFAESMFLKYHKAANAAGCTIVSYCGIDSIPADMGTLFLKSAFAAEGSVCAAVEMAHAVQFDPKYGLGANYATYESAVNGFGHVSELRAIRKKMDREIGLPALPRLGPKLAIRSRLLLPFTYYPRINAYAMVFPGADAACVRLSQRQSRLLALGSDNTTSVKTLQPVQFAAYFAIPSLKAALMISFYGLLLSMLAPFKWGRKLLLSYSSLFTHGVFRKGRQPSEKQIAGCSMATTLIGHGYRDPKAREGGYTREIVARVSGPEPGYVGTPIVVISCAHTMLAEREKIPKGVLMPAAAFGDTGLVELLDSRGEKFEIVSRRDL